MGFRGPEFPTLAMPELPENFFGSKDLVGCCIQVLWGPYMGSSVRGFHHKFLSECIGLYFAVWVAESLGLRVWFIFSAGLYKHKS